MFKWSSLMIWIFCVVAYLAVICGLVLFLAPGENMNGVLTCIFLGAGFLGWVPVIVHWKTRPTETPGWRKKWLFFHFMAPPVLFCAGLFIAVVSHGVWLFFTQEYEFHSLLLLPVTMLFAGLTYGVTAVVASLFYMLLGVLLKWWLLSPAVNPRFSGKESQ